MLQMPKPQSLAINRGKQVESTLCKANMRQLSQIHQMAKRALGMLGASESSGDRRSIITVPTK